MLGPWRWMVIVYVYLEDEDRVVVVTIQDGRSSAAATAARALETAIALSENTVERDEPARRLDELRAAG